MENEIAKDYFGNDVQVGDIIIRPVYSSVEERKVVKITRLSIYLEGIHYIWNPTKKRYEATSNSFGKPLRISREYWEYRIFNKSKLTNND